MYRWSSQKYTVGRSESGPISWIENLSFINSILSVRRDCAELLFCYSSVEPSDKGHQVVQHSWKWVLCEMFEYAIRYSWHGLCCRLDLKDIKVVCKLGGTIDDSEMVEGTIFDHKASKAAGGPTRVENAKIGLVQFCISPPKTDLENNVIISDYSQMDRYDS